MAWGEKWPIFVSVTRFCVILVDKKLSCHDLCTKIQLPLKKKDVLTFNKN